MDIKTLVLNMVDESIELKEKIKRYEKALYIIYNMATEDDCDFMIDIIIDVMSGNEVMSHYEKDVVKGKKLLDEVLEGE